MIVEHLDDLGEVGERAGEAVHLLDDNCIDQPDSNMTIAIPLLGLRDPAFAPISADD